MHISASNTIKGRVVRVHKGAVMSEVYIQVADGIELMSIISNASVDRLGLQEGKECYAVIKATDIMVGTDH